MGRKQRKELSTPAGIGATAPRAEPRETDTLLPWMMHAASSMYLPHRPAKVGPSVTDVPHPFQWGILSDACRKEKLSA